MKKRIDSLRKSRRGGFTLVELVVVLIILGILAASVIPSLSGYISKAKEKTVIAQTRQAVMAAQTLIDEQYSYGTALIKDDKLDQENAVKKEDITDLAELTGKGELGDITLDGAKIKTLTWTPTGGTVCVYVVDDSGARFHKDTPDGEVIG